MKRIILAVVLVFLLQAPLFAQQQPKPRRDKLTDISRATLWSGAGFDLGTTFYALRNDNRREANPVLGNNRAQIAVTSIAFTAISDIAATDLYKDGHHKLSAALRFFGGAIHIGAGIHNVNTGTKR